MRVPLDKDALAARHAVLDGAVGRGVLVGVPSDVADALARFAAGDLPISEAADLIRWQRKSGRRFSAAACAAVLGALAEMAHSPLPPPIVFLDLDGVLMTRRALVLPENVALAAELAAHSESRHSSEKIAPRLTFDRASLLLVVRLCERSGAKLVLHTNWRRNVGAAATKASLVRQGIPDACFHPDFACPMRFSSEKCHDIHEWLADHATAIDTRPPPLRRAEPWDLSARQRRADERRVKPFLETLGFECVVIDDERLGSGSELERLRIATAMDDGFSPMHYRTALGALGGVDPELGVDAVEADLLARVVAAHGGDRLAAARWLWEPPPSDRFDRRLPDPERVREEARSMRLFGYGYDPEEVIARRMAAFAASLEAVVKARRTGGGRRRRFDELNF